jgi:hypothetical protein
MRIKAVAILIETVCRRSSHQLIAMLVALATLFTGSSACADELVTLNARPGVSLSMLIWKPLQAKPETVVLLIPGGDGDIGLGWQNAVQKRKPPISTPQSGKRCCRKGRGRSHRPAFGSGGYDAEIPYFATTSGGYAGSATGAAASLPGRSSRADGA